MHKVALIQLVLTGPLNIQPATQSEMCVLTAYIDKGRFLFAKETDRREQSEPTTV